MPPKNVKNALLVTTALLVGGASAACDASQASSAIEPRVAGTPSSQPVSTRPTRPPKSPKPPAAVHIGYLGSEVAKLTWKKSPAAVGYQLYSGGKKIARTGRGRVEATVGATYGHHCYSVVALGRKGVADSKRSHQVCLEVGPPPPALPSIGPIRPPSFPPYVPPPCYPATCAPVRAT